MQGRPIGFQGLAGLSGWKSPDRPVCGARAWLGFCQFMHVVVFFCEIHGCFDEVVVWWKSRERKGRRRNRRRWRRRKGKEKEEEE